MTVEDNLKKQLKEKNPIVKSLKPLKLEHDVVKQIVSARVEQNITQKELADRIGIKQSNISRLESGNHNPSLEFLRKVATGLGKELHIEFR